MPRGRPVAPVHLEDAEREQLLGMVRSHSLPCGLARRARIVLLCADGESNLAVAEVINAALHSEPPNATHWSVRGMAEHTGVSKTTVHRWFRLFGVQPHRQRHFKLSTDPLFVDKVRDIVGLCLNPPDKAVVLCVDEKSQIQALNRTRPVLPMGLGCVEGVTHDYVRHGTTTLFAALDVATGKVLARCSERHRHGEFLSFLRHIDASVPKHLDVHLVVDNCATHKHAKVRAWLASRPRYHLHFTPTCSLAQPGRALVRHRHPAGHSPRFVHQRPAAHRPHRLLRRTLQPQGFPFVWVATAESILAKIERLCKLISGTSH